MQFAFNVDKLLRRFFPDPTAFRSLQARTSTLISGSTALQFFDRSFYPESDLDLYTPPWARREVGRWLIREGYQFAPFPGLQPSSFEEAATAPIQQANSTAVLYSLPGVAAIFTFKKTVTRDKELTVQIVVASRSPLESILGFHSTCVMNIISYERAYCFFPRATLEDRRTLISASYVGRNRRRAHGLAKYRRRGWKLDMTIPMQLRDGPHPLYKLGHRWANDGHTWVIQLDITGVEPPPPANPFTRPMSHDPVHVSNWYVSYSDRNGATMISGVIEREALRHPYVITEEGIVDHLIDILERKETEENFKADARLEDWTYYDAELADMCMEYRAKELPAVDYLG